jgi:hypothetical protein
VSHFIHFLLKHFFALFRSARVTCPPIAEDPEAGPFFWQVPGYAANRETDLFIQSGTWIACHSEQARRADEESGRGDFPTHPDPSPAFGRFGMTERGAAPGRDRLQ